MLAVQRQGGRLLNDYFEKTGITASQAEAISILESRQPLTLKELGNLLICEAGSPSRLVDRMVADGIIEKVVHPDDSRAVLLRLTAEGQAIAKRIKEIEEDAYRYINQLLTDQEIKSVNGMLEKFIKAFPIHETLVSRGYI
nr:winged helix DNA-binding protein [Paenibacillus sp. MMS18-CY102]